MKKLLSFLGVLTCFMYVLTPLASANELEDSESQVSALFVNFIDEAYKNVDLLNVEDAYGKDVKNQFVNETSQYYADKNYLEIQSVIENQALKISYERREDLKPQTRGTIKGQSVSKHFYHISFEATGTYRKEWVTLLSGNFSYDTSTMQVTSVNGPRISLDTANFGAIWTPFLADVLTSNSKSGAGATFSANYTMKSSIGGSIGKFPIGYVFNFGNYTDKWTASSMQP